MIDKQKTSENVYFLNTVTVDDLLPLAEQGKEPPKEVTPEPEPKPTEPVEEIPDPEPEKTDVAPVVHGRWIEDHDYLKCAKCGVMVKWDFTFFDIGNWNYCPNCGAKMDIEDGGDNNEAD